VDIAELKQKSVAELHALAEQLNITNYSGLRKQDLIFRIEQSLLDQDTVIRGEGCAGDPAGRLWVPPQPGLELPLRA
jgi:transcription termination factor Rho